MVATPQRGRLSLGSQLHSGVLSYPATRAKHPNDQSRVRACDPEPSQLNRRYIVLLEQEAARRYHKALSARLAADIRADGGATDDQAQSERLTWNLAHAARRWERTLIALGRPLPPELLAVMTSVAPPLL